MEKAYFPVFLTTLLALFCTDATNPPVWGTAVVAGLLLIGAVSFLALQRPRFSYALLTLAFAFLFSAAFAHQKKVHGRIAASTIPTRQYVTLVGRVLKYPSIDSRSSTVLIRSEYYRHRKQRRNFTSNLRIRVLGNLSRLYRGHRIRINCQLFRPDFSSNFFPSPREDYPLYRNFHFTGHCKSARMVQILDPPPFYFRLIGAWRNRIRRQLVRLYYRDQTGSLTPGGVFLQAILLGDRSRMKTSEKEKMLNAGVYHLVAISGAHIGIIAVFSLLLFRTARFSYRGSRLFTAGILCLFLAISGFHISALRAVLVALLVILGRCYYLDSNPLNLISLSGLIILTLHPAQFLDPGFILTFALAMAIVVGRGIFLPPIRKWPRFLGEFVSANLSASLIALPLSIYYFKSYSFLSLPAGLLLIPITAVVTALGLLLLLSAPLGGIAGPFVFLLLKVPLDIFFGIIDGLQGFSVLRIYHSSPSPLLIIGMFLCFYLLGRTPRRIPAFLLAGLFLLGAVASAVRFSYYQPGRLEAFFLDVGSGDAAVVVFANGDGLLIDGGGQVHSDYQIGKEKVLPFILEQGIRIRWFALSHYHPDHARGLLELIPVLKPEEIWISSSASQNPWYRELIRISRRTRIQHLDQDFIRRIGGSTVRCLYPPRFIPAPHTCNNHSQVLKIADSGLSFLFTGDIESEVEQQLLKTHRRRLPARVLKVPHHGSDSSSTLPFLKAVNPSVGLFSYGKHNFYHFPHPRVVRDYRQMGIRMLSTAESGGIRITTGADQELIIETSR